MIGIFDSGIGGLTVVRELLRRAPDASFMYLGDTARLPYGNKSRETIIRFVLEDAAFLVKRGASSLVIACNTMSAYAVPALRKAYPALPIFDVISPAIEDALSVTKGRVGIIGTRATVGSNAYQVQLFTTPIQLDVTAQACPLFVPLVEEGWFDDPETKRIIKRYLSSLRQHQVDTLILGCTHYPLLAPHIQRYMGNRTKLIDSGVSVVSRLLSHSDLVQPGRQSYFLTDVSPRSCEVARNWLHQNIEIETAHLASVT